MRRLLLLTLAVFALSISFCAPSQRANLEFCIAWDKPAPGLEEVKIPGSFKSVYMDVSSRIYGSDIDSVVGGEGENGLVSLGVKLTEKGEQKLFNLTQDCEGKYLAILVDGEVRSVPKLESQFDCKGLIIRGGQEGFTEQEAERISKSYPGQ